MEILIVTLTLSVLGICLFMKCMTELGKRIDKLEKKIDNLQYQTNDVLNHIDIVHHGRMFVDYSGECMLFPSKDQRDWSKFKAKKPKFDPNTLKPFDKVLVKNFHYYDKNLWKCAFYSHQNQHTEATIFKYATTDNTYTACIPYNEDTKHLVGTADEAPEFYRYWEE